MIVCAVGDAVIVKSVTFTAGCTTLTAAPPFALALPEIVIVLLTTGTAGVKSTSTVATAFTAKVGILHEMVEPCTVPQLPEPLVTLAVGVDASPLVGKPVALNTTRFATSGPLFVMLKVNATCVPAATGFGDGLVEGATIARVLTGVILVTKASCGPLKVGLYAFAVTGKLPD